MGGKRKEAVKGRFWAKLYTISLIFSGILCISYVIFGFSLGWGFYFGLKIILLFGIILLVHGILRSCSRKYKKSLANKIVNAGICFVFLFVICMEAMIGYGAIFNNTEDIDYAFILGAGIIEDRPSFELKSRLDEIIEYVNHNPIKKIVLCGGKGEDEQFTEAYVMEKYLLDHGVDEDMLIKEEQSTNTYDNIKFAMKIIENTDKSENKKIALVSNYFHIFRAKLIADKLGLNTIGLTAPTPLYIIPNHHVREYFAIIKFLLFE